MSYDNWPSFESMVHFTGSHAPPVRMSFLYYLQQLSQCGNLGSYRLAHHTPCISSIHACVARAAIRSSATQRQEWRTSSDVDVMFVLQSQCHRTVDGRRFPELIHPSSSVGL